MLVLTLWRRDIPIAALSRRYGDETSRFLNLPSGVRLHYRDVGPRESPALLCIHGYSASSIDWLAWAKRLQGRYRLVLIDLPGHGLTLAPATYRSSVATMAKCVEALACALDLQQFVVIGNSMGGQVAMTYATDHQDRVAGLVLIASTGANDTRSAARQPTAVRLLASSIGRFALRHLDVTLLIRRGLMNAFACDYPDIDALVRQYFDLARAPGHRTILTTLQLGGRGVSLPSALSEFERPALIMAGDSDELVPVSQSRTIAARLPRARLIIYEGVGHVPMQQIPTQSAEDLSKWLASIPRFI